MQKFKNALSGIAYHKVLGSLIFTIFSVSLFFLTFTYSLSTVQKHKIEDLTSRWKSLKEILPQGNDVSLQVYIKNNQSVITYYQEIYKYLLFVVSITFILFAIIFTIYRRKDILALHQSEMSFRQIITHLLLELLVPICASFILLVSILFLFQGNYQKIVSTTNNQVYKEQVFEANEDSLSSKTTNQTYPHSLKKRKLLLPFNTHSVYYVDTRESISFHQIFKNVFGSFVFLLFLFSSICSILIYGYYRYLSTIHL